MSATATTTTDNNNNMIRTIVHTVSGASIKVHRYGATVVSYVTNGREQLFVSEKAILDGSKPIRGGIPLVFPIFGPSSTNDDTMPQHGFARRSVWNVIREYDTDDNTDAGPAGIVFELVVRKDTIPPDAVGTNNEWSKFLYGCTIQYEVAFTANKLHTTLRIINTGTIPLPTFQTLFHTYYHIANHAAISNTDGTTGKCSISGLQGYHITDKVTPSTIHDTIQNDTPITIQSEVDRVYSPVNTSVSSSTTKEEPTIIVTVGDSNLTPIQIECSGSIVDSSSSSSSSTLSSATTLPVSYVVWNPYEMKAKEMSDFGNDEYYDMVCVEPGLLLKDQFPMVQPNQTALFQQTIIATTFK